MCENRLGKLLNLVRGTLAETLVPAILPATCGGCGWPGDWFCQRCEVMIEPEPGPGCWRCGRSGQRRRDCVRCRELFPERLILLRSAFVLNGVLRRGIHRFKYLREYRRGDDLGARLAGRTPEMLPSSFQPDIIVPVPLHPRRRRQRGFNQSEILAGHVGAELDVTLDLCLERIRNTDSQTRLSGPDRERNVAGAFSVRADADYVEGKRVLLIDDVSSTGSTVASAAQALQEANVGEVGALVLAREG
jgi:ComF family protein